MAKRLNSDFTVDDCFFGSLKLNKNAGPGNRDIVVMVSDFMHVCNFHW